MKKTGNIFKKLKGPALISVVVLFVMIIFVVATSWVLYSRTVIILTENLRERLLTISITQAANLDAKDINQLQIEDDWKKSEWGNVINKLHKAKYSNNDIVFMYVFRKMKDDPTKMEFVADADSIDPFANIVNDPSGEVIPASSCSKCIDSNRDGEIDPNGADKLQYPGQPFPEIEEVPEAWDAYEAPNTVKDIYTDEYGSVLTGFAPIKDENGNTVAILGTDIKADDFFTITKQTLEPFLIFIASLLLVIVILVFIMISSWNKYNRRIQVANEKLTEANQNQSSLMHFMNHQVKGRLGFAKNVFAELLTEDYGAVPEEARPLLQQGLEEVNLGVDYVQNILKGASAENGTLPYDMKPMDFKAEVEEVVKIQKSMAEKKGLKLNFAADSGYFGVNGDVMLLGEAVKNLIDNSINYTPEGSIDVGLTIVGKSVRLKIKDTGVGISDEDKTKLFKSGGRGTESLKVNTNSTGYGLVFVKGVVESHKGKVWAESEGKGKGSTFYVELPKS